VDGYARAIPPAIDLRRAERAAGARTSSEVLFPRRPFGDPLQRGESTTDWMAGRLCANGSETSTNNSRPETMKRRWSGGRGIRTHEDGDTALAVFKSAAAEAGTCETAVRRLGADTYPTRATGRVTVTDATWTCLPPA
jgi:hypothetical protein